MRRGWLPFLKYGQMMATVDERNAIFPVDLDRPQCGVNVYQQPSTYDLTEHPLRVTVVDGERWWKPYRESSKWTPVRKVEA